MTDWSGHIHYIDDHLVIHFISLFADYVFDDDGSADAYLFHHTTKIFDLTPSILVSVLHDATYTLSVVLVLFLFFLLPLIMYAGLHIPEEVLVNMFFYWEIKIIQTEVLVMLVV